MSIEGDINLQNLNAQERQEKRRKTRSSLQRKIGIILLVIVLWIGLVWGGYYTAKQYFDQAMERVQQTNAMNIQTLNNRLDHLNTEIQDLKRELNSTDQTLSSASHIQRELNQKIELLHTQLQELEHSLRILKEAPHAID